jgi:hypothetical protein
MQCQPIRKFWNDEVPGTCPLTPMMSVFAAGIPHFIIEIAILLCPLFEIWRLHLPFARKIAVAAMFASGLLVCGSALGTIIHTLALDKKPDKDLTWDGIDDQIWAVCDVNLASLASELSSSSFYRPFFNPWCSITPPPPPYISFVRWILRRRIRQLALAAEIRALRFHAHVRKRADQAQPRKERCRE